jgi:hypothetical protein
VAQTADAKKAQVAAQTGVPSLDQLYSATLARNSGVGNQTLPSQELADLNSLTPYDLAKKYGFSRAQDMINGQLQAQGATQTDINTQRSLPQAAGDFATGVGLGVANSVGGVGALAAGLVSKRAGTAVASGIKALNDVVQQNLQSDGMNAHRQVNAARNELGYRDSEAEYDRTKGTDGEFMAGLRRIGKDAATAVGNAVTDPTVASDGVAQGIGSLLTAGPIGRGISLGANALVGGVARRALVEGAIAADAGAGGASALLGRAATSPLGSKVLDFAKHEGATMAGIGATEAGGAYQQNAADVMDMKFEDLQKTSPMFNQLVEDGMKKMGPNPTPEQVTALQEEARRTVANRSGLLAAAIQAPIATATGALVSKFESAPLKIPTLRQLGQNILKEGTEETIQSGTGQAAQNIATKQTANDKQDLLQGVGEQAGLGGLYGMASAGVVSGPGSILSSGTRAALGISNKAVELAGKRGDRIMAENEAKSPVSDQSIATAAAEAVQNAPAAAQAATDAIDKSDLTPSQKEEAHSYVEQAKGVVHFDPAEVQGMPEVIQRAAEGQTSRLQFFQNLANEAKNPKNSAQEQALALATLQASIDGVLGEKGINIASAEFNALPDTHDAKLFTGDVAELWTKFQQSPAGKTASNEERAAKTAERVAKENLTPEHFDTPEGQQAVQANIAAAQLSPQHSNRANNELILNMAAAGKITLDNRQSAALRIANAILGEQEKHQAQLKQVGAKSASDLVSHQVTVNEGSPEGAESAKEHMDAIRWAYGRGDFKGAKAALLGFQNFVQSQQNKIRAVNTQIATHGGNANPNNALHYDAALQDKSGFRKSDKPFGVSVQGKRAANSIGFVQQVAAETQALTGIHNALATAFPELGVKHVESVSLDPLLSDAHPSKVAKEFADGTRGKKQDKPSATEPVKEKESAAQSSKPSAPDEAPKQPVTSAQQSAPKDAVKETTKPAEPVNDTSSQKEEPAQPHDVAQEREALINRKIAGPLTVQEEARLREIDQEIHAGVNKGLERDLPTVGESDGKGVSALYPNLIVPVGGNFFTRAFRLPSEARSKLAGVEKPLEQVRDALNTEPNFRAASGKSTRGFDDKTRAAYRYHLSFAPKMVAAFNEHLQAMLKKSTNAQDIVSGAKDPNRYRNGKLLNIAEETEDGLRLNQSLAEAAALAGLQWVLGAQNNASHYDTMDIASIFGVRPDQVTEEMENHLKSGSARIEGYSSLAQKIQTYWGLASDPNMDVAYTHGILDAMAAEILDTMTDPETGLKLRDGTPFVREVTKTVDVRTGEIVDTREVAKDGEIPKAFTGKNYKSIPVLQTPALEKFGALQKLPDAIERVIATKPELSHYLDGELPTPPKEQMRNPGVKLTDEQKQMIANETDTVHKLDMDSVALFRAIDRDWMAKIFGPGDIDPKKLNKNDLNSQEGQKLSITGAFDAFLDLTAQVEDHAAANGKEPGEVEIRYGYNVSKVGRLQMLGAFNPQASKLMRHAVLPTESTLELTSTKDQQAWWLGVAQGLGVKVHNMTPEMARTEAEKALAGKYAVPLSIMKSFLQSGKLEPEDLENLHASLGSGASFAALYAVLQQAKYELAQQNGDDLSKFKTKLYLEADGKTNGPIMAMAMFGRGKMTANEVINLSRGGVLFGDSQTNTAGLQFIKDPIDLYKATANNLNQTLSELLQETSGMDADVREQLAHLLKVMNVLLGDNVIKFDGSTGVEMGRDIAKNPLTVTMYSSGPNGIANKIAGMLTDAVYAQMSKALQNNWKIGELFGPEQKEKNEILNTSLKALMDRVVDKGETDELILAENKERDTKNQKMTEFTFGPMDRLTIQKNIRMLFVDPMRASIGAVVGQDVFDAMQMVQQATQVQSIFQEYAYNQAVDAALKARQDDPKATDYRKGDYLSQKQLDEIQKSVRNLSPYIEAPGQTFYMSGKQKVTPQVDSFGSALSDRYRAPAVLNGPGNIGVAGPASINIGMGDGRMIQSFSTMPGVVGNHLNIFDGIHFALSDIEQGSKQANEAAWTAMTGNPLKAVSRAYQTFLAHIPATEVTFGSDLHKALVAALYGPFAATDKGLKRNPPAKVIAALQTLGEDLSSGSDAVDARHRALMRVNVTIDQMAGASSPHRIGGKESIDAAASPDEIAARITELTAEEQAKIDAQNEKAPRTSEALNTDLAAAGEPHRTGVKIWRFDGVRNLIGNVLKRLPREQAVMLESIARSMQADGYTLIHGNREQLTAYNESLGAMKVDAANLANPNVQGFTMPGRQQVWIVNPSSETLTHELIHAATMNAVLAHYNGENLGKHHAQVTEAIQNLETLMQQFLGLNDDIDSLPREMQVAYHNAFTAINTALNNPDLDPATRSAAALNEYMAWGLANQQLAALQKKVDAHPLVKMAQSVIDWLRQIVFGKQLVKTPGEDMFSHLQFNTQVVLTAQPTMGQMMRDTVLYQNAQYGNDQRLAELGDMFDRTITNWVADAKGNVPEMLRRQYEAKHLAQQQGTRLSNAFATVFPMTLQEKTTFHQIVAGLVTEAHFDPNVLARMHQLWSLVNKHLDATMMEDPNELDPNQRRHDAQEKVDAIRGDIFEEYDSKGRSTLLPTFMALAMTNDHFRSVLAKIATEKQARSDAESRVDQALENFATDTLDALGRRLSGERKSPDVLAAMDALSARFMDLAQERQTAMDLYLKNSGGVIDSANDYMVQGMGDLARFLVQKADKIDTQTSNKLVRLGTNSTRLFAAIINEEQAGIVAEGMLTYANKIQAFKPFTDLIHDMIGRVASNAEVYDMIKAVRSMVQKMRQQFREEVPKIIAKQFSRNLTEAEWDLLHKGMGKTDLASLAQGMSQNEVLSMLKDRKARETKIKELEDQIQSLDKPYFDFRKKKMQELAKYMVTGQTSSDLLRNAHAIARMAGTPNWLVSKASKDLVKPIDMLTSLYALEQLDDVEHMKLSMLANQEEKGMKFALSYLQGQRADEMTKAQSNDRALLNHFKGYIPQVQQAGTSLIVADDSEYAELTKRSYVRIGDYEGSRAEPGKTKKGYYFLPVSGRNAFQQGILQNVRQTAGGVDVASGYSQMASAGRITSPKEVSRIQSLVSAGLEGDKEHLLPIFNDQGEVVAYERSLNPEMVNSKLQFNTRLHEMLGVWRGRQVEEELASHYNTQLIDRLADMYDADMAKDAANKDRYIDVFDKRELAKDPVLADAVKLITPAMKQQIQQKFGKQFFVRRDMLNDALGYRSASVGDAWTGNSRWSDDTQKQVQRIAMSVFGNKAYQYAVTAEKKWQNFVSDAKTMIVVKSVVVPISNLVSNAYQLASRGVPIKDIITGMPRKTAEVKAYVASELRRIEADAELRAAEGQGKVDVARKLKAEIQSIRDSHKRLSIWPLIEAGEFSAISDGQATAEEVELTSGRLSEYFERKVNQLPAGIRTAGRYAMITKDTALFKGMQTAVEYGDFLAKAILYDDLTKRKKQSREYALARVTEEYVNYDRLPGRFRGYVESMGLMWFYNFKIRSAKVALSMIRNNPVHALLAGLAPTPPLLGSIGTPITDNIFTQAASGKLHYSFGFGQLFHAPMMLPLENILSR